MYLKLRSQLMPYIYSTAYTSANLGEGSEKGKPQVRAMFLEFPEDANTYSKNMQYQFMFGKDFLSGSSISKYKEEIRMEMILEMVSIYQIQTKYGSITLQENNIMVERR